MNVLIAYDGSTHADRAIADLAHAGLPTTGSARVFTAADVVLPPSSVGRFVDGEPGGALRALPAQVATAVRAAVDFAAWGADRARTVLPGWNVAAVAQADAPAWGIVKECDTWQPDLAVVGSQGLGSARRILIGSVSQRVLTEARCPVRVARGRREENTELPRLLVGVDGSAGSFAAVRAAAARSWHPGTAALVMGVVEGRIPEGPTLDAFLGDALADRDRADHEATMRAVLDRAAALLAGSHPDLEVGTSLVEGDPKRTLLDRAKEWRADTVFVGARGLVGASRMLLGSVSTAVAMRAHCSVEVVHAR